jgi:hypothetical protein
LASLAEGGRPGVKVVSSEDEFQAIYYQLAQGGSPVTNSYPGTMVQLPDGTLVGMRAASTSGGPTIDIT